MAACSLIGLDWGTTSLRAYRLDGGGTVLERRELALGISQLKDGDFAGALAGSIGDWLDAEPAVPVLACGMIGSRQGWREVAYVPCPCDAAAIARGVATVELAAGRRLHLVPGIDRRDADTGMPDVIRGEETQVLGELALRGVAGGRFVLPGTHSKWLTVEDGRITGFRTYMTGAVFAALRRHTILGRLMEDGGHDADAFARGVDQGTSSPADLLHGLFATRTLGLFGDLRPDALASFLSGVLIGAELASARSWLGGDPVVVIGASGLTDLYLEALTAAGAKAEAGHADCVAAGLASLASTARLTEEPRA